MVDGGDALDELIAEGTKENPDFGTLVNAAARRRKLLRSFGRLRSGQGLTQRDVAERMRTSQAHVATLERGDSDPKLSTLERYATALGLTLVFSLEHREEMGAMTQGSSTRSRVTGAEAIHQSPTEKVAAVN